MEKLTWFERQFTFGLSLGMLPFYLERLSGAIARIEAIVTNLSDEKLSFPLDDKWSVKQNIGHLAEVDEIALKRIDEMIAGISPMSPAVIQPGKPYNQQQVSDVIKYFAANRKRNIQRYESLSQGELQRSSEHPRLKVRMTPVDLAWFDAEHDDHHMVRIHEIISTINDL